MKRIRRDKVRIEADPWGPVAPVPNAGEGLDSAGLIDRLLRRPMVNLDTPEVQRFLAGKRVLVTGAGGSIGSEICRQTLRFLPERLVLLEQAEGALFEVDQELRQRWLGANLVPYVADISDKRRIARVFNAERPQVIFHCAAHKHVPMMEINPGEAIKNNVFGTKTVADAAVACGAAAFVMVSTDKAVNPTSVMGCTKRCAELYVQSLTRRHPRTRFVAVRFGNVLGSSGSVVPVFRQQIAGGGPVTVTHREITRYFMTIPEAAQLVIQAGGMAKGGEVFVLDMGEPVRIHDLAVRMIELSGLKVRDEQNPDGDVDIAVTGLRPGEKLYEELLIGDNPIATDHPRIMMAREKFLPLESLASRLAQMREALNEQDVMAVREILSELVPDYRPTGAPADWVLVKEQVAPSLLSSADSSKLIVSPR